MPDNELQVIPQAKVSVKKPAQDAKFAKRSADLLNDIVKQNKWAIKLGGDKSHLVYEAWQTLGKYYGYTVTTFEAEEVEIGGVSGFKAKAKVINEVTGVEIGGAEAYCMRDEPNWKSKPTFQLASMAQTRAGAKALRQILSFVVALAGYNPTPAEEMTGDENKQSTQVNGELITEKQIGFVQRLLKQKGYPISSIKTKYRVEIAELTREQASSIIEKLMQLPDSMVAEAPLNSDDEVNIDDIPDDLGEAK